MLTDPDRRVPLFGRLVEGEAGFMGACIAPVNPRYRLIELLIDELTAWLLSPSLFLRPDRVGRAIPCLEGFDAHLGIASGSSANLLLHESYLENKPLS
jgi:hypothetical protein